MSANFNMHSFVRLGVPRIRVFGAVKYIEIFLENRVMKGRAKVTLNIS